VENLPVGAQQRVEIVKGADAGRSRADPRRADRRADPQETEGLFRVIRSLAGSGRSVLFITHKLKEVLTIADRITVMRLGKVVGTHYASGDHRGRAGDHMVGRAVELV